VETEGVNVGENQAVLLRKIEELTLYIIQLNDRIQDQERRLTQQKRQILELRRASK
jgi:hypothetical protein